MIVKLWQSTLSTEISCSSQRATTTTSPRFSRCPTAGTTQRPSSMWPPCLTCWLQGPTSPPPGTPWRWPTMEKGGAGTSQMGGDHGPTSLKPDPPLAASPLNKSFNARPSLLLIGKVWFSVQYIIMHFQRVLDDQWTPEPASLLLPKILNPLRTCVSSPLGGLEQWRFCTK